MAKASLDERRARLVKIGSALPEASSDQTGRMGEHTTFRVRKKTFAYLLVNHPATDASRCAARLRRANSRR